MGNWETLSLHRHRWGRGVEGEKNGEKVEVSAVARAWEIFSFLRYLSALGSWLWAAPDGSSPTALLVFLLVCHCCGIIAHRQSLHIYKHKWLFSLPVVYENPNDWTLFPFRILKLDLIWLSLLLLPNLIFVFSSLLPNPSLSHASFLSSSLLPSLPHTSFFPSHHTFAEFSLWYRPVIANFFCETS